jgi:outer membrane protein W
MIKETNTLKNLYSTVSFSVCEKGERIMKVLKVLLISVLLFQASPAIAAEQNWYLGAQIGQALLIGDSSDRVDDGISWGMFGGYRINSNVSLDAALFYSSHDDEVGDPGDYTINMLSFTFGPQFSAVMRRNVELYAGSGLGIYTIDFTYEPEGEPKTPRDETDGESGIYGCAGMNFLLKKNMHLGFDVRYHHVFEDEVFDGDMITMMVRLGFNL